MPRSAANVRGYDTRDPALVWRVRFHRLKSLKRPEQSGARGCSAVGSAQPCQGWGREFESRHPLECRGSSPEESRHVGSIHTWWRGRAARHRPAKPFTRVRIPSPPRRTTEYACTGAIGAAVARFPDTEEVTGSIPVSRTKKTPGNSGGFCVRAAGATSSGEPGPFLRGRRVLGEVLAPPRGKHPWSDAVAR